MIMTQIAEVMKEKNEKRMDLLEDLGYSVSEDCDQNGMWVWTSAYDGCDMSYDTKLEALSGAWSDLAGQIMAAHDMSDGEWDVLSFEQQKELILELDD